MSVTLFATYAVSVAIEPPAIAGVADANGCRAGHPRRGTAREVRAFGLIPTCFRKRLSDGRSMAVVAGPALSVIMAASGVQTAGRH